MCDAANIQIDICYSDDVEIGLYARGHHDPEAFRAAAADAPLFGYEVGGAP